MPDDKNKDIALSDEQKKKLFSDDTIKLAENVGKFVQEFYPAYTATDIDKASLEKSWDFMRNFTFYRISDCTIDKTDDAFKFFAEKMQKLFVAAHSIHRFVCYGIVSYNGKTSLVVGLQKTGGKVPMRILEGLLPGITLETFTDFDVSKYNSKGHERDKETEKDRYVGCVSGIPALKVDGEYLPKDLSSLMRSLNGENYTLMAVCKPMERRDIQAKIDKATQIYDECFAISKRTLSYSSGTSEGTTDTETYNKTDGTTNTKTKNMGMNGVLPGAALGAAAGSIIPGVGTVAGAVAGGLIGLISGVNFSTGESASESRSISLGYSRAVCETISKNASIAGDIQNGFAIELMKMCENIRERCKIGRNIGMWQTVVSYSAESEIAAEIIKGSLYSELASGLPEVLPPVEFSFTDSFYDKGVKDRSKIHNQQLMLPKNFMGADGSGSKSSPLCSFVTSEELCGICTVPTDTTVGFAVHQAKDYPLACRNDADAFAVGQICEFSRPVANAQFALSKADLNKHTFVCGITGSGKTNTVKKILETADVPFLVLEPAKKEYRNLNLNKNKEPLNVYSLGRPELNCMRMNPFYIMPGVSPQQHIDLLKDLFSASFAFYGPMPYIMEKCLNNIYCKKGWDLTLGFHPYLINAKSQDEMFSRSAMEKAYKNPAHIHLFPTMQDLKTDIDRYIETMPYEGEVKGNIRGALQSRVESLCVSSKGYMFNTREHLDMAALLKQNAVIELEGLADDADKAFALGLLIIYINEARAIQKEMGGANGLQHLLVIEEAHRLLTNVSAEDSEYLGNPKGKAVEHFTNLLAEMRSYGQGVVIAEQIPNKLAPEVIKNTANKIVHRLVAKDDQEVIANTAGIESENAIYLGGLKTGFALCHKEGMLQPVSVKIDEAKTDKTVADESLYKKDLSKRMEALARNMYETRLSGIIQLYALKILSSIMYGANGETLYKGIDNAVEKIRKAARTDDLPAIPDVDGTSVKKILKETLKDEVLSFFTSGAFRGDALPEDFIADLNALVDLPDDKTLKRLRDKLERFYAIKPDKKLIKTVADELANSYENGKSLANDCNAYLLEDSADFCRAVTSHLEEQTKRTKGGR